MITPNNQDISNFLGGVYSNPVPLAPQIPGANVGQNANIYNQPNSGYNQPDASQLQMISAMMQATPNSNTNHSVSNGGWATSYGKPNPSTSMGTSAPSMGATSQALPNMFGR